MKRSPLKRTKGLRRTAPLRRTVPVRVNTEAPGRIVVTVGAGRTRRKPIPPAVDAAVRKRSRGRCVSCGRHLGGRGQRHHVLPVRLFPEVELEQTNLVLVCDGCHDEHERAHRRLRRSMLPQGIAAIARQVGPSAVAYLERTYPA